MTPRVPQHFSLQHGTPSAKRRYSKSHTRQVAVGVKYKSVASQTDRFHSGTGLIALHLDRSRLPQARSNSILHRIMRTPSCKMRGSLPHRTTTYSHPTTAFGTRGHRVTLVKVKGERTCAPLVATLRRGQVELKPLRFETSFTPKYTLSHLAASKYEVYQYLPTC